MMKMKKLHTLILALFIISLSGCDKDLLDLYPGDKITEGSFWKTEADANLALTACYPYLGAPDLIFHDCMADNAFSQFPWDGFQEFGNGTQDADSGLPGWTWEGAYKGIRTCNDFLANVDKVDAVESLKIRMKAECRFLRASLYSDLINFFGAVPLITEPQYLDMDYLVARTPKTEVLSFIVSELTDCASILPASYSGSDVGRITKWAATSLKARVLLYNEQYAEAATAAKDVIDNGGFSLYDNFGDLFGYQAENSSETILAHQYISNEHDSWHFVAHAPASFGGWSSVCPLIDLVDTYECIDGQSIASSPLYDAANPYDNRDPRLAHTIILPGADFAGATIDSHPESESSDAAGKNNASYTGFHLRKHILAEDVDIPWNTGCDFMLIRLAEVKLIYAEAKIESNEIDASVLEQINDIRERAYNGTGIPYPVVSTTNQSELRQILRNERRVELAFEGFRYNDIRRWKIAEDVRTGDSFGMRYVDGGGNNQQVPVEKGRLFNPNRDYLWPIPSSEMELNPNLAPNNPGY